jgi:hypothetical protein
MSLAFRSAAAELLHGLGKPARVCFVSRLSPRSKGLAVWVMIENPGTKRQQPELSDEAIVPDD